MLDIIRTYVPDRSDGASSFFAMIRSARLPASTYVSALAVLAIGLFLWTKSAHGASPSLDEPFGIITTLELIEIAVIVRMTRKLPVSPSIATWEFGVTAVSCGLIALLVSAQIAFALLVCVLTLRFVRSRSLRNPGVALLIIGLRNVTHVDSLIGVYRPSALFDAAVIKMLMRLFVSPTSGVGAIVAPDAGFAIDITGGCSSAIIAANALEGFLVLVLGLRGRFCRSDLAWAAALIASMHLLNWIRLFAMALSEDRYEFWHNGNGAALIAFMGGALTCLAAWKAISGPPGAPPLRARAPA